MRKNSFSGFSLIELMIVVFIIGILAAIAIPNYNEHVMKARITEGVGRLSEMRTKMEQFFQDNRAYTSACAAGTVVGLASSYDTSHFTFSCNIPDANTYVITAAGTGKMTGFTYTINQANARATTAVPTGWTANASCWVMTKGGGC